MQHFQSLKSSRTRMAATCRDTLNLEAMSPNFCGQGDPNPLMKGTASSAGIRSSAAMESHARSSAGSLWHAILRPDISPSKRWPISWASVNRLRTGGLFAFSFTTSSPWGSRNSPPSNGSGSSMILLTPSLAAKACRGSPGVRRERTNAAVATLGSFSPVKEQRRSK
jgi:hypothetical protein